MTPQWTPEDFGDPQLKLRGFQLWVHGRSNEYPGEYGDDNWLRVTAHCGGNGSSVWAEGSILQVGDLRVFGATCAQLQAGMGNRAHLPSLEGHLSIWIVKEDEHGHFTARVWLTPDPVHQVHSVKFELDQTDLAKTVTACERITREFGSGDHPRAAPAQPVEVGEASIEEEFAASELYLRSMIGRSIEACALDGRWTFSMGAEVQLDVGCPWRLLEHGRIKFSGTDGGNSFETGLPEDSSDGASRLLTGKRIRDVRLSNGTLDLVLDLGSGLRLEILPTYVRYEAWEFHAPGRTGLIAQGSGVLCLM